MNERDSLPSLAQHSSLGRRIVANYAQTLVTVAAPFVTLPLYNRFLGAPGMTALTFGTVIASLVSTTEAGISQVLSADFARAGESHSPRGAEAILAAVQRYYFRVLPALAAAVFAGLAVYATRSAPGSAASAVTWIDVLLITAQVCLPFVSSPARSYLLGTSRHELLAKITITSLLVRHGGGIATAMFMRSGTAVLASLALSWVLEATLRVRACRVDHTFATDNAHAREVVRRGLRMSLALLAAAFATTVDRLIAGRVLSPADFSYVGIATSLAYAPTVGITPYLQSIQPALFAAAGEPDRLWTIYRRLVLFVVLYISLLAGGFHMFGIPVISIWLHDVQASASVAACIAPMLIGTALNIISVSGYTEAVSRGAHRRLLASNAATLAVVVVAAGAWYSRVGVQAAAASSIIMNALVVCTTFPLLVDVYRRSTQRKCPETEPRTLVD